MSDCPRHRLLRSPYVVKKKLRHSPSICCSRHDCPSSRYAIKAKAERALPVKTFPGVSHQGATIGTMLSPNPTGIISFATAENVCCATPSRCPWPGAELTRLFAGILCMTEIHEYVAQNVSSSTSLDRETHLLRVIEVLVSKSDL